MDKHLILCLVCDLTFCVHSNEVQSAARGILVGIVVTVFVHLGERVKLFTSSLAHVANFTVFVEVKSVSSLGF